MPYYQFFAGFLKGDKIEQVYFWFVF